MTKLINLLLGRKCPDPARLGMRQYYQRLDGMGYGSIMAYQQWLAERGRKPCVNSLMDWQDERRRAAGLVFPARALDRAAA